MSDGEVKASDLLTQLERDMALLSPEQRAELEREINAATADMSWVPNPGPQTRAYFSEADQLLYGGRAGGGKTDLILALALQAHDRSLLLRRQNKEVHFLVERMTQILGTQEGYNGQDKRWRMPNGKIIMFGGCQHEGDEVQYKGEPKDLICVQRGTQIVMGDGSRKAIEDIRIGDMVMTLEGPRRTKRTIPLRRDHAVRVNVYDGSGCVIGSQVQSLTHCLLTSHGWISADLARRHSDGLEKRAKKSYDASRLRAGEIGGSQSFPKRGPLLRQSLPQVDGSTASLDGFRSYGPGNRYFSIPSGGQSWRHCLAPSFSIQSYGPDKSWLSPQSLCSTLPSIDECFSSCPQHRGGSSLATLDRLNLLALDVCEMQSPRGTDCEASDVRLQDARLPPLSFDPQGHLERHLELSLPSASLNIRESDELDALKLSSLRDLMDRYSIDFRLCDEPPRIWIARPDESRGDLRSLRQSCDVGRPTPNRSEDDVSDCTRRYSRSRGETYLHPYTMEIRSASAETETTSCFSWEYAGVVDLFDIEVEEVNHYISDGGFVNKNCFDEATEFLESQVVFVTTWLRSAKEGQRKRIIFATNPPTTADGEWVIRWFAPWIDDQHELYGKVADGELLWCIRDGDKFLWFDKPGSYPTSDGRMVPALSRTFIRSGLKDNPEIDRSGEYAAMLANLPEAMRLRYEQGHFGLNMSDDAWQVIPSDWVKRAMNRWVDKPPQGTEMSAIGVDVAQGGPDRTVLAMRYGDWFAPIVAVPGVDTRDGIAVAQLVFREMRNNCQVNIDIGGGYGAHALAHLKENEVSVMGFQGNEATNGKDMSGHMSFLNRRAEAWWMLREALDPNSTHKIALPPDPKLRTQLCCARWVPKGKNVIQIESKDDMKLRLNGRSPDYADAVVMAWYTRETRTRPRMSELRNFQQANMGHSKFKAMYRKGRQGNHVPVMTKQGLWH